MNDKKKAASKKPAAEAPSKEVVCQRLVNQAKLAAQHKRHSQCVVALEQLEALLWPKKEEPKKDG